MLSITTRGSFCAILLALAYTLANISIAGATSTSTATGSGTGSGTGMVYTFSGQITSLSTKWSNNGLSGNGTSWVNYYYGNSYKVVGFAPFLTLQPNSIIIEFQDQSQSRLAVATPNPDGSMEIVYCNGYAQKPGSGGETQLYVINTAGIVRETYSPQGQILQRESAGMYGSITNETFVYDPNTGLLLEEVTSSAGNVITKTTYTTNGNVSTAVHYACTSSCDEGESAIFTPEETITRTCDNNGHDLEVTITKGNETIIGTYHESAYGSYQIEYREKDGQEEGGELERIEYYNAAGTLIATSSEDGIIDPTFGLLIDPIAFVLDANLRDLEYSILIDPNSPSTVTYVNGTTINYPGQYFADLIDEETARLFNLEDLLDLEGGNILSYNLGGVTGTCQQARSDEYPTGGSASITGSTNNQLTLCSEVFNSLTLNSELDALFGYSVSGTNLIIDSLNNQTRINTELELVSIEAYSPNPVPEPASLLLFGTGLTALASWGRKKKTTASPS